MTRARLHAILGWVPPALSLAAILLLVIALSTGWERGLKDEGAVAHLWQIFIGLQVPFVAAFLATTDLHGRAAAARRLGWMAAALRLALAPVALLRL